MERWNNCAPCWGGLNCWNKLLSPLPHLQHSHINPCAPPHPVPEGSLWGGCRLEARRKAEFTWVIIISLYHTHTRGAGEIPPGRLQPPGLLQFGALFLHSIDIGWRLGETVFITVGATLNHSLDRTGSEDLSQHLVVGSPPVIPLLCSKEDLSLTGILQT